MLSRGLLSTVQRQRGAREALDERNSSYNDTHREVVVAELLRLVDHGIEPRDMAAVCPYAAQASRLRQQLSDLVERG